MTEPKTPADQAELPSKAPGHYTVAAAHDWYGTKACDWEKFLCLVWIGGRVGAVVVYEGQNGRDNKGFVWEIK